jgi:hypothetical protein
MVVFVIKCTNTWLGKLRSNKFTPKSNAVIIVATCVGFLSLVQYEYKVTLSRLYYNIGCCDCVIINHFSCYR